MRFFFLVITLTIATWTVCLASADDGASDSSNAKFIEQIVSDYGLTDLPSIDSFQEFTTTVIPSPTRATAPEDVSSSAHAVFVYSLGCAESEKAFPNVVAALRRFKEDTHGDPVAALTLPRRVALLDGLNVADAIMESLGIRKFPALAIFRNGKLVGVHRDDFSNVDLIVRLLRITVLSKCSATRFEAAAGASSPTTSWLSSSSDSAAPSTSQLPSDVVVAVEMPDDTDGSTPQLSALCDVAMKWAVTEPKALSFVFAIGAVSFDRLVSRLCALRPADEQQHNTDCVLPSAPGRIVIAKRWSLPSKDDGSSPDTGAAATDRRIRLSHTSMGAAGDFNVLLARHATPLYGRTQTSSTMADLYRLRVVHPQAFTVTAATDVALRVDPKVTFPTAVFIVPTVTCADHMHKLRAFWERKLTSQLALHYPDIAFATIPEGSASGLIRRLGFHRRHLAENRTTFAVIAGGLYYSFAPRADAGVFRFNAAAFKTFLDDVLSGRQPPVAAPNAAEAPAASPTARWSTYNTWQLATASDAAAFLAGGEAPGAGTGDGFIEAFSSQAGRFVRLVSFRFPWCSTCRAFDEYLQNKLAAAASTSACDESATATGALATCGEDSPFAKTFLLVVDGVRVALQPVVVDLHESPVLVDAEYYVPDPLLGGVTSSVVVAEVVATTSPNAPPRGAIYSSPVADGIESVRPDNFDGEAYLSKVLRRLL